MDVKEFTKLLKKWKRNKDCPETLDLNGKKLGNAHAHILEEALRRNTSIKTLTLSGNLIGDEGGLSLAKLIVQNPSMTDVDFSFNDLTDKSITHILQAVRANTKIVNLNLLGNDCSAHIEQEIQNLLAGRRPFRPLLSPIGSASGGKLISGATSQKASNVDLMAVAASDDQQVSPKDAWATTSSSSSRGSKIGNYSGKQRRKSVKEPKKEERASTTNHVIAFDELDMKFQDMMNTFFREYSDLKEVTNSLQAKKQALEQECNILEMKSMGLQRTISVLETEIASEQSTLKRFRQLRQELVKKPIALDLTNVVIGEPLAALGGSSAEVLIARVDGWKCAVKKMDLSCCSDAEIQSFRREIAILERLPSHPNICRYLFHTELADRHLAVFMTEYETTLRSLLNRTKQHLTKPTLLKYSQDIIEGLEFLHSNEVIHRDLKTENVFVSASAAKGKNGEHPVNMVLGDFDTARIMKGKERSTSCIGTPHIMAPEVYNSLNTPYSFPADVYSFGMVLYEMMNIEMPYQNVPYTQMAELVMKGDRLDTTKFVGEYDEFIWIFVQCTMFDPAQRPTATQVKQWLKLVGENKQPPYEYSRPPNAAATESDNDVSPTSSLTSSSSSPNVGDDFSLSAQATKDEASNLLVSRKKGASLPAVLRVSGKLPNQASLNTIPVAGMKFDLVKLQSAIKAGDLASVKNQIAAVSKVCGKKWADSKEAALSTPVDLQNGWSALHEAAAKAHVGICKVLLDAGAAPSATTVDGTTAFHFLSKYDFATLAADHDCDMISLFDALSDHGKLINKPNDRGETPLHYACFYETPNMSTIQYLIEHGADVNCASKRGTTALEMALFVNKPKEIIEALLRAGSVLKKSHFQIVAADPVKTKILTDHARDNIVQ
eukprot:TRINITY_DN11865_c0_g1_i1.p1 TRINITY_DN11865_c0_g1~~TRINITY_DN11865_c0_g1_i1.p1  ORF type:complete len:952 (+),score=190.13 TRINITY_DN11865_c0_g1_i1:190-2856(+)